MVLSRGAPIVILVLVIKEINILIADILATTKININTVQKYGKTPYKATHFCKRKIFVKAACIV